MSLRYHVLIVAASISIVILASIVFSINSDTTGPICIGIAWFYFGILAWSLKASAPARAKRLVQFRHPEQVKDVRAPATKAPVRRIEHRRSVGRRGAGVARAWLVLLWILLLPLFLLAAAMTVVGLAVLKMGIVSFYLEALAAGRGSTATTPSTPTKQNRTIRVSRSFS